jgi:Zn-dependent M28 family amino/carboxypeptidase
MMTEGLRAHVTALAGRIGERNVGHPQALKAAADYIRAEWSAQGYCVNSQAYRVGEVLCENLEVVRTGNRDAGRIWLVGAHYDTVPGSPGADDNASGIAALLEISRLFATCAPAATVRFVAFVNEEQPYHSTQQMGSTVYAQAARGRNDDIRLMVSLEMLGCYDDRAGSQTYPPLYKYFYPDRGNFIAFVSNLGSRSMLHRLAAAFRAGSDFPLEHLATFARVPGVSWSDQISFWQAGYPAVMVTDTAFHRYPHYHSAFDTPEKLDYARFARVTEGLYHAFARLAAGEQNMPS